MTLLAVEHCLVVVDALVLLDVDHDGYLCPVDAMPQWEGHYHSGCPEHAVVQRSPFWVEAPVVQAEAEVGTVVVPILVHECDPQCLAVMCRDMVVEV